MNRCSPGLELKLARVRVEMSQFELSMESGVPNYNLSKYEAGKYALSREDLDRVWAAIKRKKSST